MRSRYRLYETGSKLSHIHINEDLTPSRSTLIYRCRNSGKFRSVWTYDGDIYVRPWTRDAKAKGDRLFEEGDIDKYRGIQPQSSAEQSEEEEEEDEDDVDEMDQQVAGIIQKEDDQEQELAQDQQTQNINI